jgi:membrane associated rhomboid family serine protease
VPTCYRHPSRETGVSCSSCGRPICPDCMTPTPVGMRCPECSRDRTKVRTAAHINAASTRMPVTITLIVINVIIYLAEGSGVTFAGSPSATSYVYSHGVLFAPPIALNHEYWRLITSGFLHASLIHIGFNMYLLFALGRMIEHAVGSVRFATIYFISLLGGSLGALIATPTAHTLGASGAVFGLMAAAFIELRRRGIDPFQAGIGPLILINLVLSFALPGVSVGGHIGGLVAGGLCGTLFVESDKRAIPTWVAYLGCLVLAAILVEGGIQAAHHAIHQFQ